MTVYTLTCQADPRDSLCAGIVAGELLVGASHGDAAHVAIDADPDDVRRFARGLLLLADQVAADAPTPPSSRGSSRVA